MFSVRTMWEKVLEKTNVRLQISVIINNKASISSTRSENVFRQRRSSLRTWFDTVVLKGNYGGGFGVLKTPPDQRVLNKICPKNGQNDRVNVPMRERPFRRRHSLVSGHGPFLSGPPQEPTLIPRGARSRCQSLHRRQAIR